MHKLSIGRLLRATVLILWMAICSVFCRDGDGFNWILYWILCGFPYGIRRMVIILVPGEDALLIILVDCILAGVIGGFFVIADLIETVFAVITAIFRLLLGRRQ